MVGWYSHIGGIMDLLMWALADFAFVGNCEIEDGEERRTLWSISPMSFPSAFVPNLSLFHEIIIFLRVVSAVVP